MSSTPNYQHLRIVFFVLHIIGGHVGLPILVAIFHLSKKISRPPTLINFCISWIFFSVFYCISLFDDLRRGYEPEQPSNACRAQAILVYGAPPMAAVAGLVEVIHIWSRIGDPSLKSSLRVEWWVNRSPLRFVMLVLPYVVLLAFTLGSGLMLHIFPERLTASNGLYCALDNSLDNAVPLFCTIVLIFIVGFEGSIILRRFRSWRELNSLAPLAKSDNSPTMIIRVGIFTAYSIITLSAGVFFLSGNQSPWPFMVQAALPLTALLVFGAHQDVAEALCFWRRTPEEPTEDTFEETLSRLQCRTNSTLALSFYESV
ncbi:hypothetical protein BDN72DRAFT_39716 [Pluteus cervinus]|uniref:Uncharacterized protein n=1 Tax=Pluteus cervinus TaxID=181527 RepID=A0ACD3BH48_9AGAR|nr:hypothetical protein BDN72DRAFT_39716 [Pluteus cervinus]